MPSETTEDKDLEKLPITRKGDLIERQRTTPPYGGFLAVPPEEVDRKGTWSDSIAGAIWERSLLQMLADAGVDLVYFVDPVQDELTLDQILEQLDTLERCVAVQYRGVEGKSPTGVEREHAAAKGRQRYGKRHSRHQFLQSAQGSDGEGGRLSGASSAHGC